MSEIFSPLSNSKNVVLIKTIEVSDIIKRWKIEFDIDVSNEFEKNNKTVSLYNCLDSGLFFFEPKIEGSTNLYKELQIKFDWYYLEDKWEYKVALNEIKKCKNVIEIGSGKGTFVNKVLKNTDIKIVGLETSEEAVLKAELDSLPVYLKTLEDFLSENPNYEFDAIISFQVLEHLSDPLSFLKAQVSYMKKGAKLILCVPNVDCFYQFSDELLDMPPHHAAKWSKKSFNYLEDILSLQLTNVLYEPLHELHINIWIRNYSRYFREKKWYGRMVFNKKTTPVIRKMLKYSLIRELIKGHTIYISYEKK